MMYSIGRVAFSPSVDVIVIVPAFVVHDQFPAAGVVPVTFKHTNELGVTFASVIVHVFGVLPHNTVAGDLYRDHPS